MPRLDIESSHRVPTRTIPFFAVGTFAITWSIIVGYICFPETAVRRAGEIRGGHLLYFVPTWAPGTAGIAVVFALAGIAKLRAFFFSRWLMWRCTAFWWVFILVGPPLVFLAGSIRKGDPLLALLPPEAVVR